MKKKNNILKNLALLFFSILLSFLLAEVIVHFIYPQDLQKYELDRDLVHIARKNAVTRLTGPEFSIISKTNSKGLIDYEHNYEFNGTTIVMLGDSFTEASHVNLEEGFSKLLEKKIQSRLEEIRIVNCGMGNSGTDHQYTLLKKECIKYNPKIVVLNFYTGNDFANNHASLIYGYDNGKLIDKRPVKFTLFQRIFHFLNTRFHTIKLAEKVFLNSESTRNFLLNIGLYKIGEPYQYNLSLQDLYFTNSQLSDAGFKKTFLIFDELADYAANNSIRLIVSIIPTKEQVDARKYNEHFGIYKTTQIKINMSQPNALLAAYLSRKNITYIDMLPYFKAQNKNNTFYFEHDEHFNKKGHEMAANIIYESLINQATVS